MLLDTYQNGSNTTLFWNINPVPLTVQTYYPEDLTMRDPIQLITTSPVWPDHYFCDNHTSIQVFNMGSIGNNLDSHIKSAQYKEQLLLKKWAPTHNLSLLDGTHWYHRTALVVMADNALRRGVISLFHDHVTARHARITKTLQLITPYYWWPNLKTFITEYVKGCATCQMTKVNTHPTHPPMFPITPADNM